MVDKNVAFWAEVSSNHHKDLERCYSFIETAARIGCSAVKFQLFRIDQLFAREILEKSHEHRRRRKWELPTEFLPHIAKKCRSENIKFACTPFDLDAVSEIEPFVDVIKIASYELLWLDLLGKCAQTGKPVVISTGMATIDEIENAVSHLRDQGCKDLTLLHCTSSYPTPASECNLAAIGTLGQRFSCPVGWSDHSRNPAVLFRAVHTWNAKLVEFHLDLEGKGAEFATGHCWLPKEIEPVIQTIETGLSSDGTGEKVPSPSELGDRSWRADPSDGLRPLKAVRETFVCKDSSGPMVEKKEKKPKEKEKHVHDLFDLGGKIAVVTGGAGDNGYGRQIAIALAESGASVVVTSRDPEKARVRAEIYKKRGLDVHGRMLDLTSEKSIGQFVSGIEEQLGAIDILFNNASDNCLDTVEDVSVEDWNRVISVNITGAMLLARTVAPAMLERERGVIVNVSSIYGVVSPDQRIYGTSGLNSPLVYGLSKAALVQMTKYLATYWAPYIRVNCITPGGLWNNQPQDFLEEYQTRTPLGRMAGPNDLKGAAVFLASDASAWITGENLVVDGGWTVW